jgi:hypothetical protein
MTNSLIKTIAQTQPAILLATLLAHLSLDLRWPATLALILGLQGLAVLASLHKRSPRARELRFIARSMVVSMTPPPSPIRRRPHLHLVP